MKNLLKTEEFLMFSFSIFMFNILSLEWWWYLVFILAPDISMLGYLFSTKAGAYCYNIAHHKGVAVALWMVGSYLANEGLMFAGILLFGHASLDRIFGYGLKYDDAFEHTHLGMLKKPSKH